MAKKYTKSEIEGMIKSLEAKEKKARSKWGKAVLQDAQWLLENVIEGYDEPYELSEKLVLNGAENWNKFSWGGSGLIPNAEIAEHYSTPSELKKVGFNKENMYVEKQPNANEDWLDVQARALRQAWWAIRDEMNGTTEFSMSLCEFSDLKQQYGQEYLQEKYPDDMIYPMDEIDELFSSAWDALRGAFFGGRYGFDQDSFNPNDDYFHFNGYGNLVSIPYLDEYLKNEIDDDNFIEWCKEQGYYEENEDEDDENMSIVDDTKDVLRATGKLAKNVVENTTSKGGLLMF